MKNNFRFATYLLFILTVGVAYGATSFLIPAKFPKNFDDLDFTTRNEFKAEDYDRYANLTPYEKLILDYTDQGLEEQIAADIAANQPQSNIQNQNNQTTNQNETQQTTTVSGGADGYCAIKNPGIPANQKIPFGSPVLHEHFIYCAPYDNLDRGKGYRRHPGYDIGCSNKTHKSFDDPVFTPADGVVKMVQPNRQGGTAGNYIMIDHGNGFKTWYMHLNKMFVKVGQTVSAGCQIGTIGNTGASLETRSKTNPDPRFSERLAHVHYEMHYKGNLSSVTTHNGATIAIEHKWPNHASIDPTQFICVYAHFKYGGCKFK